MNTEELKALLEQSESDEKACEQLGAMSFELAAEVIKLREQQRWIPVSERLPTHIHSVLGVIVGGGLVLDASDAMIDTVSYDPDSGRWLQFVGNDSGLDGDAIVQVTHWMPLPEAPAGEQA